MKRLTLCFAFLVLAPGAAFAEPAPPEVPAPQPEAPVTAPPSDAGDPPEPREATTDATPNEATSTEVTSNEAPTESADDPTPQDAAVVVNATDDAAPHDVGVPAEPELEPEPATAPRLTPWVGFGLHLSLLGDRLAYSALTIRTGYAINAGVRFGDWGVFGHIEHDLWVDSEQALKFRRGVLNIGVGGEYFYANRRVRTAITGGLAVLLSDQALNTAPHFGLFVEIRPTGIRWRKGDWVIQLDPLGLNVIAPVLLSPAIVDVQYRTTLTIEWHRPSRDASAR